MSKRLSVILLAAFTIFGCQDDPRGYVARDWSLAIRELQMTPVFPPREDVQVGDIYVEQLTGKEEQDDWLRGNDFLPIGAWMGNVSGINGAISDFYKERLIFPETPPPPRPPANGPAPIPDGFNQPSDPNRDIFDAPKANHRLKLVGPPTFLSRTFNGEDINAAVPGLGFALGISNSRAKAVTLTIPQAETYAYPVGRMSPMVLDSSGELQAETGLRGLQLPKGASLRVLYEVYYARVIEVTIDTATDFNLDGDIDLPERWFLPMTPSPGAPTPTPTEKEVEANANAGSNGVIFKVVSRTRTGIALKGIFQHPVAIGFRYFLLDSQGGGKYTLTLPFPIPGDPVTGGSSVGGRDAATGTPSFIGPDQVSPSPNPGR